MEAGERALFPTQSPQSFPQDWGRIGYGFWDGEVEEKEQFSKGGSEDRKKKKKGIRQWNKENVRLTDAGQKVGEELSGKK